jgi:hypothetical protein
MANRSIRKSKTTPAPLPLTDATEKTDPPATSSTADQTALPTGATAPPTEMSSLASEPPHLLTPLAAVWPEAAPAEKPAGPPPATASGKAAPAAVQVAFVLLDLGAKRVSLCGDFNGWSKEATPMTREDSGYWKTTLTLAPGRYEYKFVVDGEWIPDPLARDNVWNHHGTLNSVLEVRG